MEVRVIGIDIAKRYFQIHELTLPETSCFDASSAETHSLS
jgi:hypothetical protein